MEPVTLWVPIKPRVKPRPRLSRHRAYTPEWALEYERAVRAEWTDLQLPMFDGHVAVNIEYYKQGSVITVAEYSGYKGGIRGDVDNLMKATLDALSGAAYADDKQVIDLRGVKLSQDAPSDASRQ